LSHELKNPTEVPHQSFSSLLITHGSSLFRRERKPDRQCLKGPAHEAPEYQAKIHQAWFIRFISGASTALDPADRSTVPSIHEKSAEMMYFPF
jgi:hypothetical protein